MKTTVLQAPSNYTSNVWYSLTTKAALVALLTAAVSCITTTASAQGCDVAGNLRWCAGDSGFNEGASCGLNALSGSLTGLPVMAAQPILGNVWPRIDMMNAAKVAAQAGLIDPAVNAAICCQVHNPSVMNCLASNRSLVANWLRN